MGVFGFSHAVNCMVMFWINSLKPKIVFDCIDKLSKTHIRDFDTDVDTDILIQACIMFEC